MLISMDLLEIAINFRKQNYLLGKRYTVPWSGVGGNPPPLKDDLGPPAHQPAARGSGARR